MLIILPFAAFALQMTREMTVNVIMQQQREAERENERERRERKRAGRCLKNMNVGPQVEQCRARRARKPQGDWSELK